VAVAGVVGVGRRWVAVQPNEFCDWGRAFGRCGGRRCLLPAAVGIVVPVLH